MPRGSGDLGTASQGYLAHGSLPASQRVLVTIPTRCDSGCASSYAPTPSSNKQSVLFPLLLKSHSKDQHRSHEQDCWIRKKTHQKPCADAPMRAETHLPLQLKSSEEGGQEELRNCHRSKRKTESADTHTQALWQFLASESIPSATRSSSHYLLSPVTY